MRTGYNGVEIRKRRRTTLGKSIYSLALSDEIIREIDALAYEQNTNRSSLINSILADYVQLTTPEQRMREVFDRMETLLLGSDTFPTPFQLLSLPSDTMMNLRSSIRYKYNPTAKHSVELYRQPEDGVTREQAERGIHDIYEEYSKGEVVL